MFCLHARLSQTELYPAMQEIIKTEADNDTDTDNNTRITLIHAKILKLFITIILDGMID